MENSKLMKKCAKCGRLNHIHEYVCEKCGSNLDIYSIPVKVTNEGEVIPVGQTHSYIPPEPHRAQAREKVQHPVKPAVSEKAEAPVKAAAPEKAKAPVRQSIPEKVQTPVRQSAPEKAKAPVKAAVPEKAKAPVKAAAPEKVQTPVRQPVPEKVQAPAKETAAYEPLPETRSFGGYGSAIACIVIAVVLLSGFLMYIKFNPKTGSTGSNITAGASGSETSENVIMTALPDPENDDPVFGSTTDRSQVGKVIFLNNLRNVPDRAWDISEAGDGSVMAWTEYESEDENSLLILYIAGEGGIAANEDSSYLFCNYSNVKSIDFNGCFYTENAENMYCMFFGCSSLENLDLSRFDTAEVTNMSGMFEGCGSLKKLNISNFDTSNTTQMFDMFGFCTSLESIDVTGFDTSEVTDMSFMFCYCESLTELNVIGFDTSKVTDMQSMFRGCSGLTRLNLSSFDTSNVTDMNNMFSWCTSLTDLDISNFDMSKANKTDMFENTVFE